MHTGGDYALIHVLDPARAAQYSALVEQHHLAGARARSEEEARFHAQRLGPAALIIAEVRQSPDGFDLLRRLRKGRRPQVAPAVLISSSMKVRDEALRLREQLDIVEVLSGSQPLSTVRAAVERAIRRGPRHGRAKRVVTPVPQQPQLGRIDLLQEVAREHGASMAVAWLGAPDSDEDAELLGWFGWDRLLVPMIGERADWTPFKNLSASAVHVPDARADVVLGTSAVVQSGMVRSFAGAPVMNEAGEQAGALWLADERPGMFGEQALQSLAVWAQRLGAAHEAATRKHAVRQLRALPGEEMFVQSAIPEVEAMEQLLLNATDGFIATDDKGRVAYANPAASQLLGVAKQRLHGMTRVRVLELARQRAGLDPVTAAALASAETEAPLLVALKRADRVVRWTTRPLPLGSAIGRMDQIVDVTAEVEERETRARLARVDPLTWLCNRRGFDEALAREISRSLRFKTPLSLMLFRIEGREDLEPPEADQLTREVAWLLAEVSRGYDHSARIDDDTLALILPGEVAEGAQAFSVRLAEEMETLRARRARGVTLLTGIAVFDAGEEASQMLARARAAMLASPASDAEAIS